MLLQLDIIDAALPEGTRRIKTRSCPKCNQKIHQTKILKKGVFVSVQSTHVCLNDKLIDHSQYPEDSFFDEENFPKEER